jgi:hypothetical protein
VLVNLEVVGIVAQALAEAGIDPAFVPPAAKDEFLAAPPAADAHFHPVRCRCRHVALTVLS